MKNVLLTLLLPFLLATIVCCQAAPILQEEAKNHIGASDETTWGNGLEADTTTSLGVLIEQMPENANKIGPSREIIEARVNQSLRKAGITPVSATTGHCLYVSVDVIGRSGFKISISFLRPVFYRSGDKWFTTGGSTWHSSGVGIASSGDNLLDAVAQLVEMFCNEFLKANGK